MVTIISDSDFTSAKSIQINNSISIQSGVSQMQASPSTRRLESTIGPVKGFGVQKGTSTFVPKKCRSVSQDIVSNS